MNQITSFLTQLGFSQTEIEIYLHLLASGSKTVTQISEHLGTARTTTFENTEKLIKKGLISHKRKLKNRLLTAESPTRLELLIAKQKVELSTQKHQLNHLEQQLPQVLNQVFAKRKNGKSSNKSSISIIKGKEKVFKHIFESIIKSDIIYSIIDLDAHLRIYPDTLKLFVEYYRKFPHRQVWEIALDTPYTRKMLKTKNELPEKLQYYCKLIPSSNYFFSSNISEYFMYDHKVSLFQFEPDNVQETIIESQDLYESFVGIHKTMWDLLPDPQV